MCEGGIEKSVFRITDWNHEACRAMTNGDHEGQIFLSHPHRNNGFFFLLTTKQPFLYWKSIKKIPENPEFAEMQHGDVIFTLQTHHRSTCGRHAAVCFLSFARAYTGRNNLNPYVVCEKYSFSQISIKTLF